ncbi:hypothetical protein [Streptomyces sp. NPDC093591]|uniref:hypothetical protein n=1 Tax=Streptomyces sp. NPDC093591 TaxID=3366044 RepID=UPI00380146C2
MVNLGIFDEARRNIKQQLDTALKAVRLPVGPLVVTPERQPVKLSLQGLPANPTVLLPALASTPTASSLVGAESAVSSFTEGTALPVTIEVTWSTGPAGSEASIKQLSRDAVELTFAPRVVERLDNAQGQALDRTVTATVSATVAVPVPQIGVVQSRRTVPPIRVRIEPLLVPTFLVLFRDAAFDSNALVVVPPGSPIGTLDELTGAGGHLGRIDDLVGGLRDKVEVATTLLGFVTGLGSVLSTLGPLRRAASTGRVRLISSRDDGSVRDLNNHKIEDGPFGIDLTWEDRTSSLLLVGPPGTRVTLYAAPRLQTHEGVLELEVGPQLHVRVASLKQHQLRAAPDPKLAKITGTRDFSDKLSSLKFRLTFRAPPAPLPR